MPVKPRGKRLHLIVKGSRDFCQILLSLRLFSRPLMVE